MNAKHELTLSIVIGLTDFLLKILKMFVNSDSKEKNDVSFNVVQNVTTSAGMTITAGAVATIFGLGFAGGAIVGGSGVVLYYLYRRNQRNKEADLAAAWQRELKLKSYYDLKTLPPPIEPSRGWGLDTMHH